MCVSYAEKSNIDYFILLYYRVSYILKKWYKYMAFHVFLTVGFVVRVHGLKSASAHLFDLYPQANLRPLPSVTYASFFYERGNNFGFVYQMVV